MRSTRCQTPPYRTGNWPMMSPSELMNLPGFGADRYRKIAPYVTALPDRHGQDQHLHRTGAGARESRRQSERRVHRQSGSARQRPQDAGVFPTWRLSATSWAQKLAQSRDPVRGHEPYFRLTTRVTLGTTQFTLYSLLYARPRRQGDAAAAHFRNTLTHMPHTLLLRLPAPGQEETEWLGIDEAGDRRPPRSSAGR